MKSEAYAHLLAIADEMPIIDTHEHLPLQGTYLDEKPDVLNDYLSHYIACDLHAAGLPFPDYHKIRDANIDLM